ncbi:hypothetical protein ACTXT7_004014 [Hymenolepis weldensis]
MCSYLISAILKLQAAEHHAFSTFKRNDEIKTDTTWLKIGQYFKLGLGAVSEQKTYVIAK